MIVCVCRRISDSKLQQAVADGYLLLPDLMRATGAGTDCGGCVSYLARLLDGPGQAGAGEPADLPEASLAGVDD